MPFKQKAVEETQIQYWKASGNSKLRFFVEAGMVDPDDQSAANIKRLHQE